MKQLPLPGMVPDQVEQIVNVASVPHRSPFRYPGGKTWLVPRIRRWLHSLPQKPAEFVEPFAGGGIVGLSVAFEQLAHRITLIELDEQVAAVWQTIIEAGEGAWLAEKIMSFELNHKNVNELLAQKNLPRRERALQTIIKNRVNRGGILATGAGRIKTGEAGRGMASRWYPKTLKKRILDIESIRQRLTFIHSDGLAFIQSHGHLQNAIFFIDPPYTIAGKKAGARLYEYSELDHEALFGLVEQIGCDFLMTYSDDAYVRKLARQHDFVTRTIAMKNTHHARQTELLIGRNLDWLE